MLISFHLIQQVLQCQVHQSEIRNGAKWIHDYRKTKCHRTETFQQWNVMTISLVLEKFRNVLEHCKSISFSLLCAYVFAHSEKPTRLSAKLGFTAWHYLHAVQLPLYLWAQISEGIYQSLDANDCTASPFRLGLCLIITMKTPRALNTSCREAQDKNSTLNFPSLPYHWDFPY